MMDGWIWDGGGARVAYRRWTCIRVGGWPLLYMHENRAHRVGVGVDGGLEERMDGGLEGGSGGKIEGRKSGRMEEDEGWVEGWIVADGWTHGGTPANGMHGGTWHASGWLEWRDEKDG